MPYTLSMALLWVALAVLLGIVVGWLMRSVVAKRQIERARSNHLDNVELERLRSRVAELEPAVVERDALRAELEPAAAERDALRAELELAVADRDAARAELGTAGSGRAPLSRQVDPQVDDSGRPGSGADLRAAAAVLGHEIALDDLTVIDGIGPKVADLCAGIGITTWRELADTEVSLLRTMLHDAGPRFRTHDPSTWPEQARLLADGRWEQFRALAQQPAGGSPVD